MSKRLTLILTLAFVVGLSLTAYAAVQNIKVSGDMLLRGIYRENFNLNESEIHQPFPFPVVPQKYKVGGLTSQVRVRIDADLTDNVSAVVRLLNERSWGNDPWGTLNGAVDNAGDEVVIDLAYATLKEFLYSPITLTIGRQELRFGNAMVIGDIDTNGFANEWQVPWDLSLRKSFDAIRATLTYEPMVIDAIYAKDHENEDWWQAGTLGIASREKTDVDLCGINARYDLSALGFKGASELYWFTRSNKLNAGVGSVSLYEPGALRKADSCNTIGALTYGEIIPKLTASLEVAYQFGNANWGGAFIGAQARANAQRSAWATQANVNYAFGGKYSPNLTLMYAIFSGDKNPASKRDRMWDPMYEDQTLNSITNALFLQTNCRYIALKGDIKPIEDVTITGVWAYYWLDRPIPGTDPRNWGWIPSPRYGYTGWYRQTGNRYLGQALDITTTYDYTEDVQFGLTLGYFNPGTAFDKTSSGLGANLNRGKFDDNAVQMIGSMKVTF